MDYKAKIFTINRLKMGTDGTGVTTLVALYQCPLSCKYCINKHGYESKVNELSIEELYNKVVVDDLYFSYTGGGICFGGHEPLIQSDFINSFIQYVKAKQHTWYFTIETSLGCSLDLSLFNLIDFWYVDIKDMNPDIYKRYTGKDIDMLIANLKMLVDKNVKLRIPKIPYFNTDADIENSKLQLKKMGFREDQFEVFKYIIRKRDRELALKYKEAFENTSKISED